MKDNGVIATLIEVAIFHSAGWRELKAVIFGCIEGPALGAGYTYPVDNIVGILLCTDNDVASIIKCGIDDWLAIFTNEVGEWSTYIGVPTFLAPKIPAKSGARRFELVLSPLRQPGERGNQNVRYGDRDTIA